AGPGSGSRCDLEFLRGAAAHRFGIAVTPDPVGQDVPVALIDRVIAHRLTLEVVRDREDLQTVLFQDVEAVLDVRVVLGGLPRVEVVSPGGDFEAVVAPFPCQAGHLLEGQVGPLAGEESDRSCHETATFLSSRTSGPRSYSGRPR